MDKKKCELRDAGHCKDHECICNFKEPEMTEENCSGKVQLKKAWNGLKLCVADVHKALDVIAEVMVLDTEEADFMERAFNGSETRSLQDDMKLMKAIYTIEAGAEWLGLLGDKAQEMASKKIVESLSDGEDVDLNGLLKEFGNESSN